jgi:hypothetical protein
MLNLSLFLNFRETRCVLAHWFRGNEAKLYYRNYFKKAKKVKKKEKLIHKKLKQKQ